MTPDEVRSYFEDGAGNFHFARWARPIVPMVMGVEQETLEVVKGAIEAVVALAGHQMGETDPEMGANLMVFFLRDWGELAEVAQLEELVPGIAAQAGRLQREAASQYRIFRFERDGAIRAAFVFLRMDDAMLSLPADALALTQAVQVMLLWGAASFASHPPLGVADGQAVVRADIAALLRAAYAPELPAASTDPAFALRVYARLAAMTSAGDGS